MSSPVMTTTAAGAERAISARSASPGRTTTSAPRTSAPTSTARDRSCAIPTPSPITLIFLRMNFLEEKRSEIDARLKELKPLYDEYLTLQKAKAALDGVNRPRRSAGGPRGGRRGRPRGSGGTSKKALETIRQNPGITVTELARELKMRHPNYLYRVLPQLESQGAVRKDGTGWHAA